MQSSRCGVFRLWVILFRILACCRNHEAIPVSLRSKASGYWAMSSVGFYYLHYVWRTLRHSHDVPSAMPLLRKEVRAHTTQFDNKICQIQRINCWDLLRIGICLDSMPQLISKKADGWSHIIWGKKNLICRNPAAGWILFSPSTGTSQAVFLNFILWQLSTQFHLVAVRSRLTYAIAETFGDVTSQESW